MNPYLDWIGWIVPGMLVVALLAFAVIILMVITEKKHL